jgi:tetratricopeptide (TPR) repeat protein
MVPHRLRLPVLAGATLVLARAALAQGVAPTTRVLVLPLTVSGAADSATSIAVADAARQRLENLAHSRVSVVPKDKLCEALKVSGFSCDILLDPTSARLLARFLNVQAYTTGGLERTGNWLTAHVRVVDIGSSGFAALFAVSDSTTAAGLGNAIAQRLNTVIRAGDAARECGDRRGKGDLNGALDAAHKALALEPDLPAAHLCVETIYEARRLPSDSLIAAALRATRGDSLNATAWETLAHLYQTKGDTLLAINAFARELAGDPQNQQLRLGVSDLLRQQKQYQRAVGILDEGLAATPGDPHLLAMKQAICIEGQLWRCTLDGFVAQAGADSTRLADSAFLKAAIGAAQQLGDTAELLHFGRAAARAFPKSPEFWKVLGSAYLSRGQRDSALVAERHAMALEPGDPNAALLLAKTIVDATVYDTATANRLKTDTVALRALRDTFAMRLDTARAVLAPALSADSTQRLSAAVLLLTGGSKLAQAADYAQAYDWLRQTLDIVAPQSAADTLGARAQVRVQANFWFGIASVASLAGPYADMVKAKSCTNAAALNARISRTKDALIAGARVQPSFVNQMLGTLGKFEAVMPKVKAQFHCSNF